MAALLSFVPIMWTGASCSTSPADSSVAATGGTGITVASSGGTPPSGPGGTSGANATAGGGSPTGAGVAGRMEQSGAAGSGGAGNAAGAGGAGAGGFGKGGTSGAAGISGASGAATTNGGIAGTAAAAGSGTAGSSVAGSGGSPPVTCPANRTVSPGETTQSIMVDGMARTFVRHVPSGYTGATPVPVVIDFHPLGGTGSSWKGSTGWAELADQEGFIVIWPDGVGNSWNAGRCCRAAMEQNIDDIAFTRAIIASLQEAACIDAKRVYATGCSNGGGMAFRVACDAADVVAGVAPVDFDCVTSADVNARSCGPECAPARPISEIQFRGTADTAVPYEGGLRAGGTTTFPGAEETFASWGDINGCTGTPAPHPDHAACEVYPMCSGGVSTTLCTVENGSHCGSYQSFDIVSIAWETLQAQALP